MGACDIENDELLWTSERTRAGSARVADLIRETKVLERIVVEKLAIPSLTKANVNNIT